MRRRRSALRGRVLSGYGDQNGVQRSLKENDSALTKSATRSDRRAPLVSARIWVSSAEWSASSKKPRRNHVADLARAIGFPAQVGLDAVRDRVRNGTVTEARKAPS
jgi:hypothetical protein